MKTFLAVLLAVVVSPQRSTCAPNLIEPNLHESQDAADVRVEALAWMAGAWSGEHQGIVSEETWMPPRGGLMLGLHRDTRAGSGTTTSPRRADFEYLRIEQRDAGLVYVAMPGGRSTTDFTLASLADERVVFENLEHDFPKRISYWLEGDDLHARAEGEMGGHARDLEWTWQRSRD